MRLFLLLLVAVFAAPANAVNLTCVVPGPNVTRGVELCEELRQQLRVRSADWDNDVCASQFLRIGMLAGERQSTRRAASATVAGLVNDAVVTMQSTWPQPTRAVCGDSTLDTETPFLEECDDGNLTNGDGCDDGCRIEP